MKAAVYRRYGSPDVVTAEETPTPRPRDDEVLVRVHAAVVGVVDSLARRGAPFYARPHFGLRRPRFPMLGSDFAGQVEAVGPRVTGFTVGEEVFGTTAPRFGAHAEYVCLRESAALAHKPAGASFEEAAAVCDGVILALMGLRPAGVGTGRTIVIYGASGSIGTAAVQLSRYFGADVTAVCDTRNVEIVGSLGAGQVIDYTREDFTKNGRSYDVIFDAVGKLPFGRCRAALRPGGIYLATDHLHNLALALWTSRIGSKKVVFPIPPRYTKPDVVFLKGLMEAGQYRAVIDRSYPLEDVVEAARYVETGQKTGNVVLTVG